MSEIIVADLPPEVVGFIGKAAASDAPTPFFKKREPESGECTHSRRIVYDPNGRALECDDCKAPLDAYALIMRMVDWCDELEAYRKRVIGYHVRFLVELVTSDAKRQGIPDDLKKRVERARYTLYTDEGLASLMALSNELDAAVREARARRARTGP